MNLSFDDELLSLKDVINWIAEKIHPNLDQIVVTKRVRETIRYATKKRHVTIKKGNDRDFVETTPFLTWASSKWPILHSVEGFPRIINSGSTKGVVPLFTSDAYGITVSNNAKEVEAAYIKAEAERHKLEVENAQLRSKLIECEDELTNWREKDAEMRRKKSEAGKKGGRGNIDKDRNW